MEEPPVFASAPVPLGAVALPPISARGLPSPPASAPSAEPKPNMLVRPPSDWAGGGGLAALAAPSAEVPAPCDAAFD